MSSLLKQLNSKRKNNISGSNHSGFLFVNFAHVYKHNYDHLCHRSDRFTR